MSRAAGTYSGVDDAHSDGSSDVGNEASSSASGDSSAADSDGSQDGLQRREQVRFHGVCFYVLGCIGAAVCVYVWKFSPESMHVGSSGLLYWKIGGVAAVLLHWGESFCFSKTIQYLNNVLSENDFERYVQRLQASEPQMKISIQNYHYEKKTKMDGTTQNKSRKDTHYAELFYGIRGSTDETLSCAQTLAMFHLLHDGMDEDSSDEEFEKGRDEKTLLLLCRFPLKFLPRCRDTERHYAETCENFWRENTRDTHQEKKTAPKLKGWKEFCMVVLSTASSNRTTRPWWMSTWVFVVATLCFMSLPYRLLLFSRAVKVNWEVLKHFSMHPETDASFRKDPIHSLKFGTGRRARAFRDVPREGGHADRYPLADDSPLIVAPTPELPPGSVAFPAKWAHRSPGVSFDEKVRLSAAQAAVFQRILDLTFVKTASQDRLTPMPRRLELTAVLRMEDARMWVRYAARRAAFAGPDAPRPKRLIGELPGSGELKTSAAIREAVRSCPPGGAPVALDELDEGLNEAYVFHGSSPGGALGIGEDGFKMTFAGSHVGAMFGRGAYFAEASSKADEYASAEPSGLFAGMCALLLCRVCLGELLYVTKSTPAIVQDIEASVNAGRCTAVLGDREATAGTFRELVAFSEDQIYPEFVIIYKRAF